MYEIIVGKISEIKKEESGGMQFVHILDMKREGLYYHCALIPFEKNELAKKFLEKLPQDKTLEVAIEIVRLSISTKLKFRGESKMGTFHSPQDYKGLVIGAKQGIFLLVFDDVSSGNLELASNGISSLSKKNCEIVFEF